MEKDQKEKNKEKEENGEGLERGKMRRMQKDQKEE